MSTQVLAVSTAHRPIALCRRVFGWGI